MVFRGAHQTAEGTGKHSGKPPGRCPRHFFIAGKPVNEVQELPVIFLHENVVSFDVAALYTLYYFDVFQERFRRLLVPERDTRNRGKGSHLLGFTPEATGQAFRRRCGCQSDTVLSGNGPVHHNRSSLFPCSIQVITPIGSGSFDLLPDPASE